MGATIQIEQHPDPAVRYEVAKRNAQQIGQEILRLQELQTHYNHEMKLNLQLILDERNDPDKS